MRSPFRTAAEYGHALLDRREVKTRRSHVCEDCGRPIEPNEYATRTTTIEAGTIRATYSCCVRVWHD